MLKSVLEKTKSVGGGMFGWLASPKVAPYVAGVMLVTMPAYLAFRYFPNSANPEIVESLFALNILLLFVLSLNIGIRWGRSKDNLNSLKKRNDSEIPD